MRRDAFCDQPPPLLPDHRSGTGSGSGSSSARGSRAARLGVNATALARTLSSGGKICANSCVGPPDQRGDEAEVTRELKRFDRHRRRRPAPPARRNKPDFGLTELIDRLHRVAHREQRVPVARLPRRRQRGKQLVLSDRRVLELVDQHVLAATAPCAGRDRSAGRPRSAPRRAAPETYV